MGVIEKNSRIYISLISVVAIISLIDLIFIINTSVNPFNIYALTEIAAKSLILIVSAIAFFKSDVKKPSVLMTLLLLNMLAVLAKRLPGLLH